MKNKINLFIALGFSPLLFENSETNKRVLNEPCKELIHFEESSHLYGEPGKVVMELVGKNWSLAPVVANGEIHEA